MSFSESSLHPLVRETNGSIYFNTDKNKVMNEKWFYLSCHIFYDMTACDSSDMLNLLNITGKKTPNNDVF